MSMLLGCNATRHVRSPQVLLKSDPSIKIQEKGQVDEGFLYQALRTEANRRMLVPKTSLHVYNLGRTLEKRLRGKKEPVKAESPPQDLAGRFYHLLKYRWGEPPVLLDTALLDQDIESLRKALFAHGFFHPQISYRIDTSRKLFRPRQQKAKVRFDIELGPEYLIDSISFAFLEQNQYTQVIKELYLSQHRYAPIQRGIRYEHRLFDQERNWAADLLNNHGFIEFSSSMVQFKVDSNLTRNLPDSSGFFPTQRGLAIQIEITESPTRFRLKDVQVRVNAPSSSAKVGQRLILESNQSQESVRDSLGLSSKKLADNLFPSFSVPSDYAHRLNYNFIAERIKISPQGDYYRLKTVEQTQNNLQALGMVQYILINVRETGYEQAEAIIDVNLAPQFRIKWGAEAFTRDLTVQNATFLPSLGANLAFRDRNAFKRSELFELTLSGSVGLLPPNNQIEAPSQVGSNSNNPLFYQFGASARVNFPRFLFTNLIEWVLPAKMTSDLIGYKPNTTLEGSFNLENFGQLTQVAPGVQLAYQWRNHRQPYAIAEKKAVEFTRFTPISLTLITPSLNIELDQFQSVSPGEVIQIDNQTLLTPLEVEVVSLPPGLYQDFLPRFSSRMQLGFTHQNYQAFRDRPSSFMQVGIEWGGNSLFLLENLIENEADDNQIFNRIYGQFARGSFEGKLFFPTGKGSELILRGAIGASIALGSSRIVPREARFFTGGINGMRGWQSNTLGPGRVRYSQDLGGQSLSFQDSLGVFQAPLDSIVLSSLSAPGGEYLLELNAEYRIDVLPALYLELAFFTDLGNVWLNRSTTEWLAGFDSNSVPEDFSSPAALSLDNFQLGWDAGIGFRFDASFLIIRIDLGQQLYSPALGGWVFQRGEPIFRQIRLNPSLAIGYPF